MTINGLRDKVHFDASDSPHFVAELAQNALYPFSQNSCKIDPLLMNKKIDGAFLENRFTMKSKAMAKYDSINLDYSRTKRTGFSEVVYGEHKNSSEIAIIVNRLLDHEGRALVTRIGLSKFNKVNKYLDENIQTTLNHIGRVAAFTKQGGDKTIALKGRVALVSAGTSDNFVIEEARATLDFFGAEYIVIQDAGIAGIDRILERKNEVETSTIAIVIAGMEGALPAVVAGLVSTPVIAVPTDVGYGLNMKGVAAFLTMINSCVGGMATTNINNGFGAAQMALAILKKM